MKTKLDQITVDQLVSLSCGDYSAICANSNSTKAKAARNILHEYRDIADPAGAKRTVAKAEAVLKARIAVVLYTMLEDLINIGEYEHVREILIMRGVRAAGMTAKRLRAEVKSRLGRAKKEIEDDALENANVSPEQIRRSFDVQTATLMAHFKFQIDTTTMKASLYAHLVARCNSEIKAQLSMLRRNIVN